MATAYPFDPSGTSAANRITNEQHVITSVNFRDYHYVIPNFAPFFAESLQIRLQYPNGTIRPLTQGVDYYLSHQFLDASRACAKPVYGSISFLDTDTAGILSITYQTVGGIWTLTPQEISRILAEQLRNPRITAWEQITNLPERFPVVDHEWDLVDMVGASQVVRAIDDISATILASTGGGLQQHITNYANPHQVSKAQVGLGNVQNYGIASQSQSEIGTVNNVYMTPLRTSQAIANIAGDMLYTHTSRVDNPHQVTKAQVGLGNVDNYLTATSTEAVAGTATNRFMTPANTAAAVTAQVGNILAAHLVNQNNPHNVTKAQVGLFNVENFLIATAEEARAGTRSDRYMTPQRTTQAMTEYVHTRIMDHELRIDNPHEVNKVQVGLGNVQNYSMADVSIAANPISTTLYVSPAVAAAIARNELNNYMGSSENPSGVTKAAIGLGNVENYAPATQSQAELGTINTAYMTPLRTAQAISVQASALVLAHASQKNNPHGVTKAQVGLDNVDNYATATDVQTLAGTATNLFVTPAGLKLAMSQNVDGSLTTHLSNRDNPHEVTAEQIGAVTVGELSDKLDSYVLRTSTDVSTMTREAFIELTLQGKAADSGLFNGKNEEQLLEFYDTSFFMHNYANSVATPGKLVQGIANKAPRGAWVVIAELDFINNLHPETENYTGQDSIFMVHGGQYWGSASTGSWGYDDLSAVFMVQASLSTFLHDGTPKLQVRQIGGFGNTTPTPLEFGYAITGNTLDDKLVIYAAVPKSHRPVVINRYTPFCNEVVAETLETEPANIRYVDIDKSGDTSALEERVATLEALINSITVV